MEIKDNDVRSEKHNPELDTNAINRAIEKASKNHNSNRGSATELCLAADPC